MVLLILHEPESPRIQKRDDRWIALACNAYGLPELGLEHNVALGGNDVLLAILIEVSRRTLHSLEFWLVETLDQFADRCDLSLIMNRPSRDMYIRGNFRSALHVPYQPEIATIEDWRSLQLDIQVRFPFHSTNTCPGNKHRKLQKHDSVLDIEDALARVSHLRSAQLGLNQQMLIELHPPVLVFHVKRFLYDVATDGIVKVSKPVGAMRLENMFGDHNNERLDDRCAFMLFYCRTAPA